MAITAELQILPHSWPLNLLRHYAPLGMTILVQCRPTGILRYCNQIYSASHGPWLKPSKDNLKLQTFTIASKIPEISVRPLSGPPLIKNFPSPQSLDISLFLNGGGTAVFLRLTSGLNLQVFTSEKQIFLKIIVQIIPYYTIISFRSPTETRYRFFHSFYAIDVCLLDQRSQL